MADQLQNGLSGGLAGAAAFLLPSLKENVLARTLSPARDDTVISVGELGGDAGLLGAAMLARKRMETLDRP